MQKKKRERKGGSFFKVMIGNFAEKMLIPMQFLLDFARELCSTNVAILNGPRGTGWRVGLKAEDGWMFFRRGWPEFIKHHDICEGYFLVFRYDGQSHFDVLVFDKSGCQKKYACADQGFDSCDSSGDSLEILGRQCGEDLPPTKENNNFPVSRRSIRRSHPSNAIKREKSTSENKPENGYKEKLRSHVKNRVAECLSGLESSNFEVSESEDNQETEPGLKRVHFENIKGKRLKAVKAGVEGESSHPNPKHPHFTAVINLSNLSRSYMCIRREFRVAKDLPIGSTMTLRDPEQRLWTVEIACRRESYDRYFRSGWKKFAVANRLEIGDTCFFEITPSMKDVIDVRIERRDTSEE